MIPTRSPYRRSAPMRLRSLVLASVLFASTGLADVVTAGAPNHVEIRGAATMAPLAYAVAERFMKDHPGTIVTVAGGGAHRGIKSVIVGTADLGLAGDASPEEYQKLAQVRKVSVVKDHVYTDALVVVVHRDNPVGDLTLSQLRDVYRGTTTNWKDVGGDDAPIVVVSHEGTSGTYETFKARVLGPDALVVPTATLTTLKGFDQAMGKSPNAIGYIPMQQASAWKAVTLGGKAATVDNLRGGQYPIWRKLYVWHLESPSPLARQVLDAFLAADVGQAVVKSLGDVPVK